MVIYRFLCVSGGTRRAAAFFRTLYSSWSASAFADDVAKTNLAAILEQHGLVNVRSL